LNFSINNIPERKKKLYEKPKPEITGVIKYENTPKYREIVIILKHFMLFIYNLILFYSQ